VQGRPVTERDPTTPQVPIIRHPEVRRMLLRQKAYVEGVLSLVVYCAQLADRQRVSDSEENKQRAHSLLEVLTPVCKAYGSDAAYESIMLALQVHGGAGYIEEFPIAQLLRDSRVFSVYEGTNEVQAMDLLGRKVAAQSGANFRALMEEIGKTLTKAAEHPELADQTAKVTQAMEAMVDVTMHLGAIGMSGDHEQYISHATPYLRAFAQLVVSWQFLWQSIAAQRAIAAGTDEPFYPAKIATAKYYIDTHVPSTLGICALIKSGEDTALHYKEEWFDAGALQSSTK
jgi:butyryl-CoA dehydrogenase